MLLQCHVRFRPSIVNQHCHPSRFALSALFFFLPTQSERELEALDSRTCSFSHAFIPDTPLCPRSSPSSSFSFARSHISHDDQRKNVSSCCLFFLLPYILHLNRAFETSVGSSLHVNNSSVGMVTVCRCWKVPKVLVQIL